jgi:hypothetical protein
MGRSGEFLIYFVFLTGHSVYAEWPFFMIELNILIFYKYIFLHKFVPLRVSISQEGKYGHISFISF